jgi:hypothetical protein
MMTELGQTIPRQEMAITSNGLPLLERRTVEKDCLAIEFGLARKDGQLIKLSLFGGYIPRVEFDFNDESKLTLGSDAVPIKTQVGNHNLEIEKNGSTIKVGITGKRVCFEELVGEDSQGNPISRKRPARLEVAINLDGPKISELIEKQQTNFDEEVVRITASPIK